MKQEVEGISTAALTVARESEKAVAFQGSMVRGDYCRDVMVWTPKSIIKDGVVPAWWFGKKASELAPADPCKRNGWFLAVSGHKPVFMAR